MERARGNPVLYALNQSFQGQRMQLRAKVLRNLVPSRYQCQLRLNDSDSASTDVPPSFGRGERSNVVLDSLPYRFDAPIGDLVSDLWQSAFRRPTLLD